MFLLRYNNNSGAPLTPVRDQGLFTFNQTVVLSRTSAGNLKRVDQRRLQEGADLLSLQHLKVTQNPVLAALLLGDLSDCKSSLRVHITTSFEDLME